MPAAFRTRPTGTPSLPRAMNSIAAPGGDDHRRAVGVGGPHHQEAGPRDAGDVAAGRLRRSDTRPRPGRCRRPAARPARGRSPGGPRPAGSAAARGPPRAGAGSGAAGRRSPPGPSAGRGALPSPASRKRRSRRKGISRTGAALGTACGPTRLLEEPPVQRRGCRSGFRLAVDSAATRDDGHVEAVRPGAERAHLHPVGGGAHRLPQRGRPRRQHVLRSRPRRNARASATAGRPPQRRSRRQERAGDVDDPPARPHQRAPPGRGPAPARPCGARGCRAAAATWRPDCAARCRSRCRARRPPPGRRLPSRSSSTSARALPLRGVRTSASAPDRRSRSWIGARRRGSPSVAIRRAPFPVCGREGQGLAAAAGAEIDDGLARLAAPPGARRAASPRPGSRTSHPGTPPRHAAPGRARPRRSGSAGRSGACGVGAGVEGGERRHHRVAAAAQGVDPDVEGRAPGERLQLRHEVVAERGRELREHEGRRVARRPPAARPAGCRSSRRARSSSLSGSRREALAREQRRHRGGGEALLQPQRADQDGARRVRAHDPGGGGAAAQGVVDEAGDARPGRPIRRSDVRGPNP